MRNIFITLLFFITVESNAQIVINRPLCTSGQCSQRINIRPHYIPRKSKSTQKQTVQRNTGKHRTHPQIKKQHSSCYGITKSGITKSGITKK